MAEIIEYFLALAFSTLLVGGSVAVFAGVTTFEGQIQFRALFSDLVKLAASAAENGSARATLQFPASNLACGTGTLTLTSAGAVDSASVGIRCNFSLAIPSGAHEITFFAGDGQLVAGLA